MKKVYSAAQYRVHIKRRQEYQADRAEKRSSRLESFYARNMTKNPFVASPKRPKITISAPTIFSITENAEDMLVFFNEIKKFAKEHYKIFIHMKDVERVTPDAIVYMLLKFEFLEQKYQDFSFNGNLPINQESRELLISSGFFEKLFKISAEENLMDKEEVLRIKSGTIPDPVVAGEVISFALERLKNSSSLASKGNYRNIIESMANTNDHAYDKADILKTWYLMAFFDKKNEKVSFAFLDSGRGIAATVKKKILENIITKNDTHLLKSALNGEFRTKTAQAERGKGLPSIKESFERKNTDNLVIIANKAYINMKAKQEITLRHTFSGTLIVWDFIKDGVEK